MSTSFFGKLPEPEMHHGAIVQMFGFFAAVFCEQCHGVISRHLSRDDAIRAAAYHNTTFKDKVLDRPQDTLSPAPPPWAAPTKGAFSWGKWFAEEIKVAD